MKKMTFAALVAAGMLFASCTSVTPVCATGNKLGSKVGESTGVYLFGVLPMNGADSSIQTAAKNGGITSISTVDEKVYMGIFTTKVTTVVTGD